MKPCLFTFILATCLISQLRCQNLQQLSSEKAFSLSGSISLSGGYYYARGYNNDYKPYNYSLNASPNFKIYGWDFPLSITFSQGSKSVSNPFMQMGVQPYYKWIKVYAGWNSMQWSPYTLNGKVFLGAGVELHPKKFRFGAMYGLMNLPLNEDSSRLVQEEARYKRRGYAFRLGVGSDENFFDLIHFHAKDQENSIAPVSDNINNSPQENTVIGFINVQKFAKKKLIWQLDASVAGWTRDTRSNVVALDSSLWSKSLSALFQLRNSSNYAWCIHNQLQYKNDRFSLSADYRRVQPEYHSLGLEYIQNDMQQIKLSEQFSAMKKKLQFSLQQTYQHDNLQNRKRVRSHRANAMISINYNPSMNWGLGFNYNAYDLFQSPGLETVEDSNKLALLVQSVSLSPRYLIMGSNATHAFNLLLSYQQTNDRNPATEMFGDSRMILVNLNYNLNLTKGLWNFGPVISYADFKNQQMGSKLLSPGILCGKTFNKGKMSAQCNVAYSMNLGINASSGNALNGSLLYRYKINKHHSCKLNTTYMASRLNTSSRNEVKLQLNYTYSF